MGVIQTKTVFANRFEELQRERINSSVRIFDITKHEGVLQSPLIKPSTPSWGELVEQIQDVVNMPGFMETRIKKLFDDGFGAELITAAEIARATAYKSPQALFTRSTSKSEGNWEKRTILVIRKTWEARRNTRDVIEKLGITDVKQTKLILSLAHKLRGRLLQYLSMATKGEGVKNAKALFFSLTYKAAYT